MKLPDFIGVGAQRSGTSWLYSLMMQHPDICFPDRRKEIHFFDRFHERGLAWYSRLFTKCTASCVGEFTPAYLFDEECPERIHRAVPGAKLIVILRNPVERAYSQFRFQVRKRGFRGSFPDYLALFPEAIERGLYFHQILRYREVFPDDQILVLFYEDLLENPLRVLRRTFQFVGVDHEFEPSEIRRRASFSEMPRLRGFYRLLAQLSQRLYRADVSWPMRWAKVLKLEHLFFRGRTHEGYPPMESEQREQLARHFRSDAEQLSKWMDRDLSKLWLLKRDTKEQSD